MEYKSIALGIQHFNRIQELKRIGRYLQLMLALSPFLESLDPFMFAFDSNVLPTIDKSNWKENFDMAMYKILYLDRESAEYIHISKTISSEWSSETYGSLKRKLKEPGNKFFDRDDLLLITKTLQVSANPVGANKAGVDYAYFVMREIAKLSNFIFPALTSGLHRKYDDMPNYTSSLKIRDIVYEQEGKDIFKNISTSDFIAYGHQVIFPRLFHYLNLINNEKLYVIDVDPRIVANDSLLKLQINNNYPYRLIDYTKPEPRLFRAWSCNDVMPTVSRMPDLRGWENNKCMQNHTAYLTDHFATSFRLNESDDYFLDKTKLSVAENKEIGNFLSKKNRYITVGWRTKSFKGELLDFNDYRNSNEIEVLKALKMFYEEYKVDVVLLSLTDSSNKEFISSSRGLIDFGGFKKLSKNDYFLLLSNSYCYLSGPSGSMDSGALLFGIPNLIFDYHPAGPQGYNPYLAYHFKKYSFNSEQPLQSNFYFQQNIPYDGPKMSDKGFNLIDSSFEELYKAFSSFYESIQFVDWEKVRYSKKEQIKFSSILNDKNISRSTNISY